MYCLFVHKACESRGTGLKLMHGSHAFSCSIDMHSQHQRESQKINIKKNRHLSRFSDRVSSQTGICWRLDSLEATPYFPSV